MDYTKHYDINVLNIANYYSLFFIKMKETIIYLRTSTEEQNPENQLKDCVELATKLGINDYEVLQEQKSAFKDNVEREVFNSIKQAIQQGKVKTLIVWDFDRLYRNRIKTVEFIRNYSKLGLKVYSYRQQWFEAINKIPEPFNEMFYDLMLQLVGWFGEEESLKKSQRIKLAVRKNEGIIYSYKGKKWGRPKVIEGEILTKIKTLRAEGKSLRSISKEVNISPAGICKALQKG